MKLIKTEDAVGQVLCHDITQIIKGKFKGAIFQKGHIIKEEDIPVLLSIGKENIYIWENNEDTLHENDAAKILRDICKGKNLHATDAKEGKIELVADTDGLLMINTKRLKDLNSLGEIMIATRPSGFVVKKGDHVCGTRIIPLVIKKSKMEEVRALASDLPIIDVLPLKPKKFGVVTTGSEILKGLIQDTFTPVLEEKLGEFGCEMIAHELSGDDHERITSIINKMLDKGCELVLCSGGMSVDPDDRTPLAIKNTGANVISYGAPVLPGAMLLIAYTSDGRAICGLPGCVMYSKRTVFDLVLPRLLADVPVTADYLSGLGNGGFCQGCAECHFPNCSFGKGS